MSDFNSASDGDETCSSSLEGTASCQIEFCLPNDNPCNGRYVVDGEPVNCIDSCNQGSLEVCADRAVEKCLEEEDTGCQTLAGSGAATPLVLFLVALLLGGRRRRAA